MSAFFKRFLTEDVFVSNSVGYKLTHSAQDYTPAPQDLNHNT